MILSAMVRPLLVRRALTYVPLDAVEPQAYGDLEVYGFASLEVDVDDQLDATGEPRTAVEGVRIDVDRRRGARRSLDLEVPEARELLAALLELKGRGLL